MKNISLAISFDRTFDGAFRKRNNFFHIWNWFWFFSIDFSFLHIWCFYWKRTICKIQTKNVVRNMLVIHWNSLFYDRLRLWMFFNAKIRSFELISNSSKRDSASWWLPFWRSRAKHRYKMAFDFKYSRNESQKMQFGYF